MVDKKKMVYVVYYSMYGHVQTLARSVVAGVEKSGGMTCFLSFLCFIIKY